MTGNNDSYSTTQHLSNATGIKKWNENQFKYQNMTQNNLTVTAKLNNVYLIETSTLRIP